MKAFKATLLLLPLAFTGCSEGDVSAKELIESGKQALEDIDLSKLSVDGMKEKVGELGGMLTSKLESIKDEASAVDVKKAVEPVVDQLSKLKGALGDNMPSMDQLGGIVDSLKSKFGGDEGIMSVLQPLIEKLQNLMK